jgi:hypothetical protein
MSMSRPRFDLLLRLVATLLALLAAVILVTAALRSDGWALSWLGFPLVGAVILNSRPRNTTGWLLLAIGIAMSTGMVTVATGSLGIRPMLEWLDWISVLVPTLIAALLLTFPGGNLPSPRWRLALLPVIVVTVSLTMVFSFSKPELIIDEGMVIPNPMHLPGLAWMAGLEAVLSWLIGGFILMVIVDLVRRYRRSQGLERQQFRWLATVATVAPILLLIGVSSPSDVLTIAAFVLALNLIPGAIGVSVLRYRLYEIDRLISRTVSYAVVIGLLAVVFLGVVTTLGSLLPVDSPIAVAGSTLTVAALFNPVRRRARDQVDRWFNRTRYRAQQVVDDFTDSIRDETEIGHLTQGLGTVVTETLRPSLVGIWVAEKP